MTYVVAGYLDNLCTKSCTNNSLGGLLVTYPVLQLVFILTMTSVGFGLLIWDSKFIQNN